MNLSHWPIYFKLLVLNTIFLCYIFLCTYILFCGMHVLCLCMCVWERWEGWRIEMKKREKGENPAADNKIQSRIGFSTRNVFQWFVKLLERLEEQRLGRVPFSWICTAQPWLWLRSWRSWTGTIETKSCGQDPQFVASGTLPFPLWLMLFSGSRCFHCDLYQEMNALCSTFLCLMFKFKLEWIHVMGFLKPIRNPSAWMSGKYRFLALCSLQYREAFKNI